MDNANSTRHGEPALLTALRRCWRLVTAPPVPDYQPTPGRPRQQLPPRELRLRELERTLDLLEQTKLRIAERGWTAGGWFSVATSGPPVSGRTNGQTRLASHAEALALLRRPSDAGPACLAGSMLLLADDQDTAHTLDDVWRAVDELYEAVHERAGRDSFPPGHRADPATRTHRLRTLTAWNDRSGRTQGDVIDLLNRGISRTITACVS